MSKYVHIQNNQLEYKLWFDSYLILKMVGGKDYSITLPELGQAIVDSNCPYIKEVTATEVEVMLNISDDNLETVLHFLESIIISDTSTKKWKLPIFFSEDGDWQFIENQTKFSKESYIKHLLNLSLTYAMNGFLPGFIYINGLPSSMHCPRKSSPSVQIKRNSVAIGGKYIGLYSLPSPAGWNIIGTVPLDIYHKGQSSIITPGDQIQFEEISQAEFDNIISANLSLEQYNG